MLQIVPTGHSKSNREMWYGMNVMNQCSIHVNRCEGLVNVMMSIDTVPREYHLPELQPPSNY